MRKLAIVAATFVLSSGLVLAQNPVADQNAKKPQNRDNKGQPITGKTQTNTGTTELPVTTTGSANRNTPGADTEAGIEQQPGRNVDVPHTAPARPNRGNSKLVRPLNPNEPGQTTDAADLNAQAASRAEIRPGTTLGVNGEMNSAPNQGAAAGSGARNLPATAAGGNSTSAATGAGAGKKAKPAAKKPQPTPGKS
jgi:hypothetical protein